MLRLVCSGHLSFPAVSLLVGGLTEIWTSRGKEATPGPPAARPEHTPRCHRPPHPTLGDNQQTEPVPRSPSPHICQMDYVNFLDCLWPRHTLTISLLPSSFSWSFRCADTCRGRNQNRWQASLSQRGARKPLGGLGAHPPWFNKRRAQESTAQLGSFLLSPRAPLLRPPQTGGVGN